MTLQLAQSAIETNRFDAAAEADHRIANHLAIIAGLVRLSAENLTKRSEPIGEKHLAVVLGSIGAKVESIARLHRILAEGGNGRGVDLTSYLREIATEVVTSLTRTGAVELEFALAFPCAVTPGQASSIGLIVCELLTNSIKYAHPAGIPGHIRIGCQTSGDYLTIEVEDDGVGLPDGMDPARDGQLGFRSIRAMAAQLGATLTFRNHPLGVAVALRINQAKENPSLVAANSA